MMSASMRRVNCGRARFDKRDAFTSVTPRHFSMRFVRRHYMLQSSRLFLSQHCRQSEGATLPYEATDCAIH